jgi:cytochrome c-type biogenesis protein CcmH
VRRPAALTLAAIAVVLLPGAASATEPRTSLPDVEDEVMCPICGTLLELSDSPQAQRERALIRRLIAQGQSKEQIKDRLVAEYGDRVLATPDDSGFDLAAWVVPVVAFLAAAVALAIGVRRWRRRGPPPPGEGRGDAPPRPEDEARLERDLARYDL